MVVMISNHYQFLVYPQHYQFLTPCCFWQLIFLGWCSDHPGNRLRNAKRGQKLPIFPAGAERLFLKESVKKDFAFLF